MAASHVALTRPRRLATGSLGLIHLALAYAYTQPALSQAAAPPPGVDRVSIVAYINALGPVWLIAFGLTGALLFVAISVAPAVLSWAHVGGVAVSATYSIAVWAGFALSTPRPAIISAILSLAVVLWHITMSDLYSSVAPAPRRRGHRAA